MYLFHPILLVIIRDIYQPFFFFQKYNVNTLKTVRLRKKYGIINIVFLWPFTCNTKNSNYRLI